jgi:hypothetical protein
MNMMGKPLSFSARQAAFEHALAMGCDRAAAFECIGAMADALQRDEPYNAMTAGMRFVDLTGTYRLMAVLLATAAEEERQNPT